MRLLDFAATATIHGVAGKDLLVAHGGRRLVSAGDDARRYLLIIGEEAESATQSTIPPSLLAFKRCGQSDEAQ